ncbi:MAG: translation initiation factor eIF-2B [Anaerolineae bacterium]|nr:translation initiation factor eIF-2B [Anaerolineae bacterium]
MTWKIQIEAVATDRRSGATQITMRTAEALHAMCKAEAFASREALLETLREVAYRLVSGQPEMASVTGLVNEVFVAAAGAPDLENVREAVIKTAQTYIDHVNRSRNEVMHKARGLIPDHVAVLTHSRSSTVAMALILAAQAGRRVKVFCHESRPLYEGRDMATELAQAGLEVVFTIDAAAFSNLQRCEMVLLGADSLTEQGVINKVGTAAIAVSAKSLGVPVYVLAETAKIWPARFGSPLISRHPAKQVWENVPESVKIINEYFDLTPWLAVSGVLTEHGLLTPDEICTISREKPINQQLQTIVAEVRSTL